LKKIFKNKKINLERGFTLVETMMTIFIFTIVMFGTTLMLKNIIDNSHQQYAVLDTVGQARYIASSFTNELRNATYGANGSYPLNEALDNEIIFFSTAPKGNGTISKVRYFVLNNVLSKGVTDPAGTPPSYNGQPEKVIPLISKMSLGATPLFYYYDGNYGGTGNPLTQPVNINQVKLVKINIIALKQLTAKSTNTFTVNAGASMRNLKTNLGN
jgi:prepilin-type N-terminal cleavage/methylation domain-containing protein